MAKLRQKEPVWGRMSLRSMLWRRHISSGDAFGHSIAAEAAFLSQKCVVEYCRAKAGLNWEILFEEAPFRAALDICRWEAFAAVLADMSVIGEGLLRPHVGERHVDLADALTRYAAQALAAHPLPAHRPEGWDDAIAALRRRLALCQLAAPLPVHEVGRASGARIVELLPIHPRLRRDDGEVVVNNIRFGLCRSHEDISRRTDLPAVAADMLARRAG